jgi:hypothetical protein
MVEDTPPRASVIREGASIFRTGFSARTVSPRHSMLCIR